MQKAISEWPYSQFCEAKKSIERSPVDFKNEILKSENAFALANQKGWGELKDPIKYPLLKKGWKIENFRYVLKYPKWSILNIQRKFTFSYPLMQGFADIFIMPKAYMDTFANYCGVFGAMNLHVEIAIPTAAMLTCDQVVHQKSKVLEHGDSNEIYKKYKGNYKRLVNEWDEEYIFIHPVKLSKWEI
jgi:hypothetical protein